MMDEFVHLAEANLPAPAQPPGGTLLARHLQCHSQIL